VGIGDQQDHNQSEHKRKTAPAFPHKPIKTDRRPDAKYYEQEIVVFQVTRGETTVQDGQFLVVPGIGKADDQQVFVPIVSDEIVSSGLPVQ